MPAAISDNLASATHHRLRRLEGADRLFVACQHVSPAFDGQDFTFLGTLLGRGHAPSNLELMFTTLHDGYFWIRPGQDGVLFTREGVAVGNTLRFRGSRSLPDPTELAQQAVRLDFDVFIAVDAWWNNYYHWLCITLPKMLMAQAVETAGASRPVIPEYHDSVEPGGKPAFSKTVWEQSLAAFGLSDDVVRLPPGIYTSARVSTILVNHQQPAYFALFEQFVDVYARVCRGLRTDPDSPKRILVKRRADGRMTSEQSMLVETAALSHGFTPVHLEDLDFVGQAELFFNAEAVIAAHGAGLSNIVFGGSGFRVLEVNRRLPPVEGHLRPWYSVIARAKRQYYSFLDADAGELERGKIESAVRKLCSGLPTARVA